MADERIGEGIWYFVAEFIIEALDGADRGEKIAGPEIMCELRRKKKGRRRESE